MAYEYTIPTARPYFYLTSKNPIESEVLLITVFVIFNCNYKPLIMKKLLLLFVFLVSLNTYSQQLFQNTEYWNTWVYQPKEGMIDAFEKAAAKKTKMFNSSRENAILTFKVVTGPNTGQYLRVMPWQSSKSYDLDRSKELKYWEENVGKYATSIGGAKRWARMKWGDMNSDANQAPSKYVQQTDYIVKPTKWNDFRRWLERIGKIYGERIPEHRRIIVSLVSGGNYNMSTTFIGFDSYARTVKEFDNTWEQEYNKRFGANAWDYDRDAFDESIEMIVGQQVQTLELVESMMPNLK
jgi:hypothetical protein